MQTYFTLFSIIFLVQISFAQTTSIYGKIIDEESGEELLFANIILEKNGVFVAGITTDFEGNYSIALDPGTYDMRVNYTGYNDRVITGIIIPAGKALKLDIELSLQVFNFDIAYPYLNIFILLYENASEYKKNSEAIRNASTKNINELLLDTPGVSIKQF